MQATGSQREISKILWAMTILKKWVEKFPQNYFEENYSQSHAEVLVCCRTFNHITL